MGCGSSKLRGTRELVATSFHSINHIPIQSIRFGSEISLIRESVGRRGCVGVTTEQRRPCARYCRAAYFFSGEPTLVSGCPRITPECRPLSADLPPHFSVDGDSRTLDSKPMSTWKHARAIRRECRRTTFEMGFWGLKSTKNRAPQRPAPSLMIQQTRNHRRDWKSVDSVRC
jgi:hypothetical protein